MNNELIKKFLRRYPNLPNPKHQPKIFEYYLKMFTHDEGLGSSPHKVDIRV